MRVPRALVVEEIQRIHKPSTHIKKSLHCLIVGDGVFDHSIVCNLKSCGILKHDDITVFKKHPSQLKGEDVDEIPAELLLADLKDGLLVGSMSTVLLNSLCFDRSIRVFTISNPKNYELSDFFMISETDYTIDLSGVPNKIYEIKRLTDVNN